VEQTEINPDTALLATLLHEAHQAALNDPALSQSPAAMRDRHAWYRVAERAKELRA